MIKRKRPAGGRRNRFIRPFNKDAEIGSCGEPKPNDEWRWKNNR